MISPAILGIRINSPCTKWASDSPIRLKPLADMGVNLIFHDNLLALRMELVLVHAAAFF